MTMHDPLVGIGYGWSWRVRWPGARRGRGARRPWPGAPVRAPRRALAKIERDLMADTPALSAKFAMFNQLSNGEPPVGVEQLPGPALRRPSAMYLAVLLALAAIVTMCVTLSTHVRTAVRPCQGTATSAPARGLSCNAYANTGQ